MGTNFYLKSKNPDLEDKHIAKTSCGWVPLFDASTGFKSVKDIKEAYDSGSYEIEDEYGQTYTWEGFTRRVIEWGNKDSTSRNWDSDVFKDDEGYEFCRREFR